MPEKIIEKYNLWQLVDRNRLVYIEIMKSLYGLPQAGLLANKLLEQRLATRGFYQCQFTLALWQHVWWPITFVLVVDKFGVKYERKQNAHHLIDTLADHCFVEYPSIGTTLNNGLI